MKKPTTTEAISFELPAEEQATIEASAAAAVELPPAALAHACGAAFVACNAPFVACNAPFVACNAPFSLE